MKTSLHRACSASAGALLLAQALQAQFSFVATRAGINADDTLDWADLGVAGTVVSQPFDLWTTGLTRQVAVSKATSGSFTRLDQDSAATHLPWDGNFLPGEAVLYTDGTAGPISLTFSRPVQAVGLQMQKADQANPDFLARIEAFDPLGASLGYFDRAGFSDASANGSALFLGVHSDVANILSIRVTAYWGEDFAVNQVSLQVPEPAGGAALGLLLGLVAVLARRVR